MKSRLSRKRRRRRAGLLATGAGALVLVAVVAVVLTPRGKSTSRGPTEEAPAGPAPHHIRTLDPLALETHVALGVSVGGPPEDSLLQYARLVMRDPEIAMWYQNWDEPLYYQSEAKAAAAVGALLMISWEPVRRGSGVPLAGIAAGDYDHYIRSAALAAAAYKRPLHIRFAPEMNLPGAPFGPGHAGNTPSLFISAWRHVVTVFRTAGAQNVKWVWSPNVSCNGHCPFTAFYPGNDWVDWAGLDGYNFGPVDDVPWESFAQLFASSYRTLLGLTSKPVMIGETSSTELGGSKAQWIKRIGPTLAHEFPHVRALIWFQRRKETDWRVNSSPASLEAFRELAASAEFR